MGGEDTATPTDVEAVTPSMDFGGMTMDDEAGHDDQEHSNAGHYRNMVALNFIIIAAGLLASVRPSAGGRWRLTAWVAGGLLIVLGFASILLPSAESSLGLAWGFAAIAWGVTFIAVAELTRRRDAHPEPTV